MKAIIVGGGIGGLTGVLGSVDGGATWTLLGNGQTWNVPTNDGALTMIGVSPIDDVKIVARQTDAWFHAGLGAGGGTTGLPARRRERVPAAAIELDGAAARGKQRALSTFAAISIRSRDAVTADRSGNPATGGRDREQ